MTALLSIKRVWLTVALFAALTLTLTAIPPVNASEAENLTTTTIAQPDQKPSSQTEHDPEVVDMAEQLGITSAEATKLFAHQGELDDYITSVVGRPEFVDYRGPFAEGGALLIVEPGQASAAVFTDVPPGLSVREAAAPAHEREARLNGLEVAAQRVAGEALLGVVYDPFDNSYTVWVTVASHNASVEGRIQAEAAREARDNGRTPDSVRIQSPDPQVQDARGGQWMTSTANNCTSGFGVVDWPIGGYLTACHCGNNTWTINGNVSTSTQHLANGGYLDRQFVVAPGSHWLVRVSPSFNVDMVNNQNKHIFFGNWYNHYGEASDDNNGGAIDAINVSAQGRLMSGTPAECTQGDSGGPVYQYVSSTDRRPKGLISAVAGPPTGPCFYVALDDQLAGTGWSLK